MTDNNDKDDQKESGNAPNKAQDTNNNSDDSLSKLDKDSAEQQGRATIFNQVRIERGFMIQGNDSRINGRPFEAEDDFRDGCYPIPMLKVTKIDTVFVQPPQFTFFRDRLQKEHLLILTGQEGSGRETLAIALMREIVSNSYYTLSPSSDLEKLSRHLRDYEGEECSFLLRNVTTDFWEKTNDFVIEKCKSLLQQKQCYLLIIPSSIDTIQDVAKAYLATVSKEQNRDLMLRRHLDYYAVQKKILLDVNRIIPDESVQPRFAQLQMNNQVDDLARIVAEAYQTQIPLNEALQKFGIITLDEVEKIYLNACQTTFERSFLIALAAFEGANPQNIRDAASMLMVMLKRPLGRERQDDENYDPAREDKQLYTKCECYRRNIIENTNAGRTVTAILEFENPNMASTILHYIWDTYDSLWDTLVDWLALIGKEGTMSFHSIELLQEAQEAGDISKFLQELPRASRGSDMRLRAAAAAGELAKHHFTYIKDNVWSNWMHHSSETRTLTSLSLLEPISYPNTQVAVLNLLKHWITLDNYNYNMTALECYTFVGALFPAEVLEILTQYYKRVFLKLRDKATELVGNAIGFIFQSGEESSDLYWIVLAYLDDCIKFKDIQLMRLAAAILVWIADENLNHGYTQLKTAIWPTLLVLSYEDKTNRYRERIAKHFVHALNQPKYNRMLEKIMFRWCLRADTDWDDMAKEYDLLIRKIYEMGSQSDKDRLTGHLRMWSSKSKFAARFVKDI